MARIDDTNHVLHVMASCASPLGHVHRTMKYIAERAGMKEFHTWHLVRDLVVSGRVTRNGKKGGTMRHTIVTAHNLVRVRVE